MADLPPTSSRSIRPIAIADLERVIAIDRVRSGQSRRHFFEKRLTAAQARADDFVHVGVVAGGRLQGFAIARVLRGEFGQKDAVAVLDAMGVDPENKERGLGQSLMEGLIEVARQRGVRLVQSQVNWKNTGLSRFFNNLNFALAPRLALERPISELREEMDEEP